MNTNDNPITNASPLAGTDVVKMEDIQNISPNTQVDTETETVVPSVDTDTETVVTPNTETVVPSLDTDTETVVAPVDTETVVAPVDTGSVVPTGEQQLESAVPMKEKNEDLKAAINTVVDYLSDKISQNVSNKVAQNISSSSSGENIQNGFDSINKTVETMASNDVTTGGGNWLNSRDAAVVENV